MLGMIEEAVLHEICRERILRGPAGKVPLSYGVITDYLHNLHSLIHHKQFKQISRLPTLCVRRQ